MALELFDNVDSGVEEGCAGRDLSSSWLILSTTSTAKVDLPEAGIPAIPIRRRSLGGMLSKYDDQDGHG